MCQRMDIKNRTRKREEKKFCFFPRSLANTSIGKKKKRERRTRDTDSYMIRVGSMSGCCCCCCDDAVDREATVAFNDVVGVLNGDCLFCKSGGVSSVL